MECPKCAAPQADDDVECTSCGVVFDRYREAQERALLSRDTLQPVVSEPQGTAPRSLIIVALIFLVAFGVIWTAKRRDSRSKLTADEAASAMLDDINMKGIKQRQRLQAEADRVQNMRNEAAAVPHVLPKPIGLTEESAAQILNQCSGFNTPQQVLLPKAYTDYQRSSLDDTYPSLAIARTDKIVEVASDGTRWVVTVPDTAHFRMTIKEDEHHYVIPLGRRRMTAIRNLTGTADTAEARFEFNFEQRVAAEILVQPFTNFHGHVSFLRKDGAWRVRRASTLTEDGRAAAHADLCS